MRIIEIAEQVRIAHLETFHEKLSSGEQLAFALKIIEGKEVPAYLSSIK